jgi:hypothetical protein
MSPRVRTVLIPGLAAVVVAEVSLYLIQRLGVRPITLLLDWHHPLQFYIPWLLGLPLVGALAALWSRRQGGTPRQVLMAATMPALGELAFMVLILTPPDVLGDVVIGRHHSIWHSLCGTGSFTISRVMVPAVALSIGGMLLGLGHPRPSVRNRSS